MPLERALGRWCLRCWRYAVRGTQERKLLPPPLLRVRDNWDDWWVVELLPAKRAHIARLVARLTAAQQAAFVQLVHTWSRHEFPEHAEACAGLILLQLAQLPLFAWLRRYAYGAWLCHHAGCLQPLHVPTAVILHNAPGGVPTDIIPLRAICIPRDPSDPPTLPPVLYRQAYAGAPWHRHTVDRQVHHALVSLFSGLGFWGLLCYWGWYGWLVHALRSSHQQTSRQTSRTLLFSRFLLVCWWLLDLVFGLLLGSAHLADAVAERGGVVPLLWTLVVLVGLSIGGALLRLYREWGYGQELRRFLERSQIVVVAVHATARQAQQPLQGSSFALAIGVSVLSALSQSKSASLSALAWCLHHMQAALGAWSFTGALDKYGLVEPVDREADKIAASTAHPYIKYLIMPRRRGRSWLQHLRSCCQLSPAKWLSCLQGWGQSMWSWGQGQQAPPQPAGPGTAAGRLGVYRRWHLVSVLFTVGWVDRPPWATHVARSVGVALGVSFVLLSGTLWKSRVLLRHPSGPQITLCEVETPLVDERQAYLRLSFDTALPEAFVVYFRSGYWANRAQQVHRSVAFPQPSVLLKLDRLMQPSVNDRNNGEIEIIYLRAIWWRKLPPVVVAKIALRHLADIARANKKSCGKS